jgi:branched-chain amino acid transport system ATP-binding protein
MSLLELQGVSAHYGLVQALFEAALSVDEGEIVCLIGPNGAGKTTVIRTITGALRVSSGSILFQGQPIHRSRTSAIIRSGISVVPEGRKIFPKMTVQENLEMGGYVRRNDGTGLRETMEAVYDLFPVLKQRAGQLGGTLSGGEQEMLAIGRAMMSRPKLMLLDEPSMGLAPVLVERTFEAISRLNKSGTTVLLVEQNANMALSIADRGYVMEGGVVGLHGTAAELRSSDTVKELYLGGRETSAV